ncbi:hemin uptake protein HemP [Castellaniella sp.]|uniref:hemin uptake protein HemP n=1 Tax=Castellaniella sp. TaxID=1955812 RepID=UPI003A9027F4
MATGSDPIHPNQAREAVEKARHIRSTDLLSNHRCLIIEHAGESYCLRLTRNERLILTKI